MTQVRETVGKISSDLAAKIPDTRSPIDLEREMQKEYIKELLNCCNEGKKKFPGDFYLVVITKKEPLMPNVLRNYFFARRSCPTPDYDQAVYSYNAQQEEISFLWVIPSKWTCIYLKLHYNEVAPEERDLLHHVLKFSDGTYWNLMKKLNNEHKDSVKLVNPEK